MHITCRCCAPTELYIAQVHHVGMVDGNYCFVMEYVHGRDLRVVLRAAADAKRPFPIDHAA